MFYYDRVNPESITGQQLDALLALGWYRMHQNVFTTSHVELGEIYRVHWLRYPVQSVRAHRSRQRIRRRNHPFTVSIEPFSSIGLAHHQLHQKYRAAIDFDGALSIEECLFGEPPVRNNIFQTHCISVYDRGNLIAAGYFDTGETAAASILHFFHPAYKRYSLGKYLILLTLDFLNNNGYRLYYPGYVVEGLSKMDYKLFLGREQAQYFHPSSAQWLPFEDSILHKPTNSDGNISGADPIHTDFTHFDV